MQLTLFYDRETGKILHSHYEVQVVEGGQPGQTRPVTPNPADLEILSGEILVSRRLERDRLGLLAAEVPIEAGRDVQLSVDVKTGRLRTWRLERADNAGQGKGA
jgi:hypothetical protein